MSKKIKILLVEDDPNFGSILKSYLELADYEVLLKTDGKQGLGAFKTYSFDLCILDIMMPEMDGFTLAKEIRKMNSKTPVIFLTAKTLKEDVLEGFRIGADDYLTKPFSPRELIARVNAVLRRTSASKVAQIIIGDISIDPERFEVMVNEKHVNLTPVEFKILHLLAQNQGKVFSRERILDHLWGNEKAVIDRTVDVHIKNLRDKLGPAGELVKNIRGVGYKVQV